MSEPTNTNESAEKSRRSAKLGLGLVGLGILIALSGGAIILSLRAPTASTYLVSPDLPIEPGDTVTYRLEERSCPTTIVAHGSGANLVVRGCAGEGDVEVPLGTLSVESYRPGESTPMAGDVVIVRESGVFARCVVVAREPDHRVRIREASGAERVVDERSALVVRSGSAP